VNLIENYLSETSRHLPEEGREDILSELRVSLEEQLNERAAAERREVSIEDEKSVLLPLGHPLKLAASYKRAQYLIGPELYPGYVYSLKIALIISFTIQLAIGLVTSAISDWNISIAELIGQLFDTGVMILTIVTLVFVALEYSSEKLSWYDDWDPSSLDGGPIHSVDTSDMFINIITEGVLLLWWNDLLRFGSEADGASILLSDTWNPLFWPVNIILGGLFLMHGYLIVQGYWNRTLLSLEVFSGLCGTGICVYLLLARPLIVIQSDVSSHPVWAENVVVTVVVGVALVWLWDTIKYTRLLRRM